MSSATATGGRAGRSSGAVRLAARPPGTGGPTALRRQSPRYGERLVMAVLLGAALLSVVVTVGIIAALALPAVDFFRQVSIVDFLTGTTWSPRF